MAAQVAQRAERSAAGYAVETVVLTTEILAAAPRWEAARLAALPGRSRGDLLGPWGENLARRFGGEALARVRRRLPTGLSHIAPVLTAKDWLPVSAQLALTEAIVDEFLGGDLRALAPLLVEDTRAGLGRVQLAALRALGAGRAFKLTTRTFSRVHERGAATVEVDGRSARLGFRGSPLFAQPTWRLLQLLATQTMLELAGTPGVATGEEAGEEAGGEGGFVATVRW